MLMLLIQIIGAIGTAIIAIILLKKDWRTKNEAIRKEAVLVTKIIFAVTIVSILNLAVTSFQSQYEISRLEKDRRQLQVTNANLSFNISKIATAQPGTDVSAKSDISEKKEEQKPVLIANDDVQDHLTVVSKIEPKKHITVTKKAEKHSESVKTVKNDISANKRNPPVNTVREPSNEPDDVPLFHFIGTGGRILSGVLVSKSIRPIYNLSVKVTNYDDLMDCKCFVGNTNSVTIGALNSQSTYLFKLPEFNRRSQSGRYLITIRFNDKLYYEEAMYTFTDRRKFSQALRIKQYEGSSLVHNTVMRGSSYQLKSINWDRGFPLSLDEQAKKAYIAAN
jgi:heme/copper-type cytochrome/quinol oxidase subunit 2